MGERLHRVVQRKAARRVAERPLLILHGHKLLKERPKDLSRHAIFGIVLVRNLTKAALRQYEGLNLPVVLVDRPGDEWKMHSVSADNEGGAFEATMRLIAMGHRDFAFVRYASLAQKGLDPDSRERQDGFLRAMKGHGLDTYSLLTYTSRTKIRSPGLDALFRPNPRPTAILCVSYSAAGLVKKAIEARGFSIPKQYSLACFQSVRAEEPHISGPRIDFGNIGRAAVNLLAQPRIPFQHIRIPTIWHDGNTVMALEH